jgi:hypothetical protein
LSPGQVFGLVISLVSVVSGALTALCGHEWAGGFIGGGGVVGLVSVFVIGRARSPEPEPLP